MSIIRMESMDLVLPLPGGWLGWRNSTTFGLLGGGEEGDASSSFETRG